MTAAPQRPRNGAPAARTAGRPGAADLHRPAAALPVRTDRRDDRLQLQRPRRAAEHHLAGVHAAQLRRPVGSLAGHGPDDRSAWGSRPSRRWSRPTFGTMIGLALTRYEFRGRWIMNLLIFIPMTAPGDHPGSIPADAVGQLRRGARLPDDPGGAHHVQHQLRGRDRAGPPGGHQPVPRGGGHGPLRRWPHHLLEGHLPDHLPRHPVGRAAGLRPLDRRLRDHPLLGRAARRRSRCGSSGSAGWASRPR